MTRGDKAEPPLSRLGGGGINQSRYHPPSTMTIVRISEGKILVISPLSVRTPFVHPCILSLSLCVYPTNQPSLLSHHHRRHITIDAYVTGLSRQWASPSLCKTEPPRSTTLSLCTWPTWVESPDLFPSPLLAAPCHIHARRHTRVWSPTSEWYVADGTTRLRGSTGACSRGNFKAPETIVRQRSRVFLVYLESTGAFRGGGKVPTNIHLPL